MTAGSDPNTEGQDGGGSPEIKDAEIQRHRRVDPLDPDFTLPLIRHMHSLGVASVKYGMDKEH